MNGWKDTEREGSEESGEGIAEGCMKRGGRWKGRIEGGRGE